MYVRDLMCYDGESDKFLVDPKNIDFEYALILMKNSYMAYEYSCYSMLFCDILLMI